MTQIAKTAKTAIATLLTIGSLSGPANAVTRITFGEYTTATAGSIGETTFDPGSTVVSTITLTTGLTFDTRGSINLKGVSQDILSWTLTINGVEYSADPGTFRDELYLITANQINFLGTKSGSTPALRFNTNPASFPPTAVGYDFSTGNAGETIEDWLERIGPISYTPQQGMVLEDSVTFNYGQEFTPFTIMVNEGTHTISAKVIPESFEDWVDSFDITPDEDGDSDGDGISALVEYAVGLDPTAYDQLPQIANGSLTFPKGEFAATDSSLSYVIQTSATLTDDSWVDADSQTEDSAEISATLPTDQGQLFARLKVLRGN
ncbi:hypothetical protein V2O64_20765 [Verrucomicrobiaceae bacterium 227]